MDLLFLSHRFFPDTDIRMSYGPYPMVYKLAKELVKNVNVKVVASGNGRETIDGIEVIRIPTFGSEIARSYCFSYTLSAANVVAKEKSDIIHAHSVDGGWLFGLIKNNTPKISTIYAFYKAHEIARPFKHGVFALNNTFEKLGAAIVNNLWDKLTMKNSDILFTLSEFSKMETIKLFKIRKKINVVYDGTDEKQFKPFDVDKKFLGFNEKDPVLLFAGGVSWRKGIDVMLKSFVETKKEYENLKLVIVGAKELKNYAELVPSKWLRDVKLVGNVPNSILPKFYNACDVFVHPSFHETFGVVLAEAMACEKPVVASNTTAIPEVVTKKEGLLVKPGGVNNFANSIATLLDNPNKAKQMGKNGRKRVRRYFTIEKLAKRHLKFYDEIL